MAFIFVTCTNNQQDQVEYKNVINKFVNSTFPTTILNLDLRQNLFNDTNSTLKGTLVSLARVKN